MSDKITRRPFDLEQRIKAAVLILGAILISTGVALIEGADDAESAAALQGLVLICIGAGILSAYRGLTGDSAENALPTAVDILDNLVKRVEARGYELDPGTVERIRAETAEREAALEGGPPGG